MTIQASSWITSKTSWTAGTKLGGVMKTNVKKISCAVLIALMANVQTADSTGLQDMWKSNVTAGGSFDTTNRSGWTGGCAIMRTPIASIQLFNFSPPHVSAGCSGADIYMGSFSYINKNQIVSTLKAIMNNAQGLLFQSAIEFISPMISGLMTKFNDLATKLNSMQMNSCQIATSMMGPISKAAQSYGESSATWLASTGAVGDWLTTKTSPSDITAATAATKEKIDASSGNIVWKAIVNSQADAKIDASMFPIPASPNDVQYKRELLMSFLGTVVTTIGNSSKTDATAINDVTSIEHDSQIGFLDLLKGGQGKKKFVCDSTDLVECKLNVTTAELTFVDARTYVRVMLFGDPAWLAPGDSAAANKKLDDQTNMTATALGQPLSANPLSLVAIIAGASTANQALDPNQSKFLDVMGNSVVGLIRDIHGDEYRNIQYLADKLENRMVLSTAIQFADAFFMSINDFAIAKRVDASGNPIAGSTTIAELPQQVRDRLAALRVEQNILLTEFNQTSDDMKKAREFVDGIISNRNRAIDHQLN